MAMEYSEKVMEHFAHPHNVGVIEDANGVGEVGNAKCGDIMRMYLKINDDGIIEDVKFQTFGCASAIATSSIATDMIKGKPVEEALTLTNKAVVEALDGLPAVKIHCSVLAEQAVKAAVADYYKRKGIPSAGPCDACDGGGWFHDHDPGPAWRGRAVRDSPSSPVSLARAAPAARHSPRAVLAPLAVTKQRSNQSPAASGSPGRTPPYFAAKIFRGSLVRFPPLPSLMGGRRWWRDRV